MDHPNILETFQYPYPSTIDDDFWVGLHYRDLKLHLIYFFHKKETLLGYCTQVAKGIQFLHENGIFHSELSLDTCFIDNEIVKIGFYGIGSLRQLFSDSEKASRICHTAPELLEENYYDYTIEQLQKGDIWSLGITIWEIFNPKTPLYPNVVDIIDYLSNQNRRLLPVKTLVPVYEFLCKQTWELDPSNRTSAIKVAEFCEKEQLDNMFL